VVPRENAPKSGAAWQANLTLVEPELTTGHSFLDPTRGQLCVEHEKRRAIYNGTRLSTFALQRNAIPDPAGARGGGRLNCDSLQNDRIIIIQVDGRTCP